MARIQFLASSYSLLGSQRPQDAARVRDRAFVTGLVREHGFDEATHNDARLFGGMPAGFQASAEEAVRSADDVDDAIDDVIREALLGRLARNEEVGAAAEEAPIAFSAALVDALLNTWSAAAKWSTDVVCAAQRAKLTCPVGGSEKKPWELSLVWKESHVHLVYWICTRTGTGRSCNVDSLNDVIWPTPNMFPVMSFENDFVIHPAVGCRARKDRVNRANLSNDIVRLKEIWNLLGKRGHKGAVSGSALGLCFACGTGAKTKVDAIADPGSLGGAVRTCIWCQLEYHAPCVAEIFQLLSDDDFKMSCPAAPDVRLPEAFGNLRSHPDDIENQIQVCALCQTMETVWGLEEPGLRDLCWEEGVVRGRLFVWPLRPLTLGQMPMSCPPPSFVGCAPPSLAPIEKMK